MIYIAHRGNTEGSNPTQENTPGQIEKAWQAGFDCEIDVWYLDKKWWLGHNEPKTIVSTAFLKKSKLWCHAKNITALARLAALGIHCFFHDKDDAVLTSRGYIWTYPGKELTRYSIACMPEWTGNLFVSGCAGICSDHIEKIRKKYENSEIKK